MKTLWNLLGFIAIPLIIYDLSTAPAETLKTLALIVMVYGLYYLLFLDDNKG